MNIKPKSPLTGYVYLAQIGSDNERLYKVGYSKNPKKRINYLQGYCGKSAKLIATFYSDNAELEEYKIHDLFYKHSHAAIFQKLVFTIPELKLIDLYRLYGVEITSREYYYLTPKKLMKMVTEFSKHQKWRQDLGGAGVTPIDADELLAALKRELESEQCQGVWYSGKRAGLNVAIACVENMKTITV